MGLHIQGGGANGAAAVYIRTVRPTMVKWIDHVDPGLLSVARDVGALTVLRIYQEVQDLGRVGDYLARVEQAILANPGIDAFEVSFNEAHQGPDQLAAKAEADILGMRLCERHGKRAVIGSFSVGMPDLAAWPAYAPALRHAAAGGHYLGLHEYGGGRLGMDAAVTGAGREALGWLCLRYRRVLDWARSVGLTMPKILITEAGIDDVTPTVEEKTRGWQTARGLHPPSVGDYAAQLRRYAERLAEDRGAVAGWCDFGFAADDPQWHPFDLSRDGAMLERVMTLQASLPDAAPAPAKPPKEPTMPDLGAMLAAEFGGQYQDLRATLPRNPGGPAGDFGRRALGLIDILAVHHTAGPKDQTWQAIAQAHVTGRQWAGIGYHVGIRRGAVSYLGDAGQARACCLDQNHRVLCVCLTGNYEADAVDQADADALRRVTAVVQKWAQATIGRQLSVKGHREVPGQQTACPGAHLLPLVHEIAAGRAPVPAPGQPSRSLLVAVDKAHREQGITLNPTAALQRAIRADGMIPTTRELEIVDGGTPYIAQRAEGLAGGGARVYYVRKGDWAHVQHLPAP